MRRITRAAAILTAGAVLAAGACGEKPENVADLPAPDLGFARQNNAVEFPSASEWVPPGEGLRLLVPLGDCVLGIGSYANGYRNVGANWAGENGCTRLALSPRPGGESGPAKDMPPANGGGWSGGGLTGAAVVAWQGGALIAAGSELTRRDPDGSLVRLAEIPFADPPESSEATRPPTATSMTRAGDRLLLVGRGLSKSGGAAAYLSDDGGATVREVALPQPAGAPAPDSPWVIASAGDSVVAASFGGPAITTWTSRDRGQTWTATRLPAGSEQRTVRGLVNIGGQWLMLGGIEDPHGPNKPLLLRSVDGAQWTVEDTSGLGEGEIVAATVDRRGELVLVGEIDQIEPFDPNRPRRYCGAVWAGPAAGPLKRGELGCGEHPPTSVATLTDGRVLIAGNRHLWVRD